VTLVIAGSVDGLPGGGEGKGGGEAGGGGLGGDGEGGLEDPCTGRPPTSRTIVVRHHL
jgi:hypothetical protein